jgi:hypothetical protein
VTVVIGACGAGGCECDVLLAARKRVCVPIGRLPRREEVVVEEQGAAG